MRPAALVQLRCISLDPAPDATAIDLYTPFTDDFGDMFVGQRIAEIPPHAQKDYLAWVMAPLKGLVAVMGMNSLPYQTSYSTSQWNRSR